MREANSRLDYVSCLCHRAIHKQYHGEQPGSQEAASRVTRGERLLQGFEQRGAVMRGLPITLSFDLLSLWSPDFSAFERPADCASFPFFGVGQETSSRLPRLRLSPAYRLRSLSIRAPATKGTLGLESNLR